MKARLSRRALMTAAVASFAVPAVSYSQGTSLPERAVKIILPAAPGGILDLTGRILAKELQDALGAPVLIDNRTGAGGRIGAEAVMRSAPDGYTLLLATNGTLTYIPAVERNGAFDPLKKLTPLSEIGSYNMIMVVHPSVPAKTVQEFISYARSNPGKIYYASSGQASGLHFAGEVFKAMTRVDMTHVAYKGAAPALQDVMANVCQVMFAPGEVLTQVQAGRVRALATTTSRRDPRMPTVPTLSEAGVNGYDLGASISLLGPKGLPREVQDKLVTAIRKVVGSTDVRAKLEALGIHVVAGTPTQLEEHLRAETATLTDVATRLNITAEK
jgi:tripartite-type tricarboxylate transporter receptor subunit TctC